MIIKTAVVFLTFVAFAAAYGYEKKGLAGGLRPIDVGKVPAEAVTAGLQKFESMRAELEGERNSMFMLTKPVIAHAESQIVAGVMYWLNVVAGTSTCRTGTTDFSTCSLTPQPLAKASIECQIKVWRKPSNVYEVQDISRDDCKNSDLLIPARVNY